MKKTIKIIFLFLFVASLGYAQSAKSKTKVANGHNEVDKTFFQKMDNLDVLINDNDLKVSKFKLTIVTKTSADPVEIDNSSNVFDAKVKDALGNLESGSKLYFEYIIAKDKNGQEKRLEPLMYSIK